MDFFYDESDGDILVIRADGGLSSANAGEFIAQVESLVDSGLRKIIIDCSALNYISSYGLSVLLRLHRKIATHGGDVKLANVPGTVVQLLTMTRLAGLFHIFPDVNRARLEFRPRDVSR